MPVLFASWEAPQSLAGVWRDIGARIGDRLREYLPRGRIYRVNGKAHVRRAYELLNEHGLFRQYVIRYDAWATESIEVFLFLRHATDWVVELCEALRPAAAVETFAANDGGALLRVVGQHDLLRRLLRLQEDLRRHGARLFVRNPYAETGGQVHFCYEFLFDPASGTWLFPHDLILRYMRVSP